MYLLIGILIPLIGTSLGSATVFLMKNKINEKIEKILLGFASGIMIAASIWSLILPSIEISEKQHIISYIPASIGFLIGIIVLIIIDKFVKKIYLKEKLEQSNYKKTIMMILAVTLHNIPEGMAVGITFAAAISETTSISIASALALAIGISIQNFPEGAIISLPLKNIGKTKKESFLYGVLSGIVEPIAAIITLLLSSIVNIILPYLLSFAAGAMIYVVVEELIPESQKEKNESLAIIGLAIGFIIMMILDVALG